MDKGETVSNWWLEVVLEWWDLNLAGSELTPNHCLYSDVLKEGLGVRSVLFVSAVGKGLETVNMIQFKDVNMRRKKNEVDWVSNFICTSEESVCFWTKLIAEMFFRNYMNDSLRTNVFVRFQPETIACACIYLAARALQVSVTHWVLQICKFQEIGTS